MPKIYTSCLHAVWLPMDKDPWVKISEINKLIRHGLPRLGKSMSDEQQYSPATRHGNPTTSWDLGPNWDLVILARETMEAWMCRVPPEQLDREGSLEPIGKILDLLLCPPFKGTAGHGLQWCLSWACCCQTCSPGSSWNFLQDFVSCFGSLTASSHTVVPDFIGRSNQHFELLGMFARSLMFCRVAR